MGASLYTVVKEFQETESERAFERIYKKLCPKINYSLRQTHIEEREDLQQELSLLVYEKALHYSLDEVPGFEEFEKKILKK
ncbi:hypothetical protein ACFSCX_20185 [Bacillus salitolerans]|uniref:Sigma-O factor regulatory protein RsoA n=1 Tax=Bacillus salitolerans TaxID=1437434 RepID=A0ABW4LUP8_9BACI